MGGGCVTRKEPHDQPRSAQAVVVPACGQFEVPLVSRQLRNIDSDPTAESSVSFLKAVGEKVSQSPQSLTRFPNWKRSLMTRAGSDFGSVCKNLHFDPGLSCADKQNQGSGVRTRQLQDCCAMFRLCRNLTASGAPVWL